MSRSVSRGQFSRRSSEGYEGVKLVDAGKITAASGEVTDGSGFSHANENFGRYFQLQYITGMTP